MTDPERIALEGYFWALFTNARNHIIRKHGDDTDLLRDMGRLESAWHDVTAHRYETPSIIERFLEQSIEDERRKRGIPSS